MIQIQVNGEPRQVTEGLSIAELLVQLKLDPRYLAVERNLELVPRTQHAETQLANNDRLEVVTLVGGG